MKRIVLEYRSKKHALDAAVAGYRSVMDRGDAAVFAELVFCLLTPASKSRSCWRAVETLTQEGLLLRGTRQSIVKHLRHVRFMHTKAKRIVKARRLMEKGSLVLFLQSFDSVVALREWLVAHVDGYGYKEASHFLRNIGFCDDLAILDRHILKNLVREGVIASVPQTLTPRRYKHIEQQMTAFSKQVQIPLAQLDMLFWSRETGDVFK